MLTPDRSERGASALTIALTMVVIMGMAAVAIDAAGFGFNERRQSQTAADVAVMAGALEFQDQDQIVTQVLDFAKRNLRQEYDDSLGEWQALWEGCVDELPVDFEALDPPVGWTVVDPTNWCIAQSPSFLRVRIPDQIIETTFARLIGFDEIQTSAVAVATLQPNEALNGLIPFAVRGGEGAGELCFQTSAAGLAVDPCTGADAGSFGAILSHWIGGNEFYSTTPDCTQSQLQGSNNGNSILDDNVAVGIDHVIGTFDGDVDGDLVVDWTYPKTTSDSNASIQASEASVDDCTVIGGTAVPTDGVPFDTVLVDVGNDLRDDVTRGMVADETFVDGGPSRLQRIPSTNADIDLESGSETWTLDNRPLWEYLLPFGSQGGTPVPECNPSLFTSATTVAELDANNVQMNLCLDKHYATSGAGVIFIDNAADSIADSPRFGWAPQLWHDDLGSGNAWRPVYQYRMVYLAGTFFNCVGTSCGLTFYPGHPGPEPLCDPQGANCKNLVLNQTTAFLLPDAAIPTPIKDSFPIQNLGPFQPRLWR